MDEEKRTNIQLEILSACDNIGLDGEACLYLYGDETYDMIYGGNLNILVETVVEAMRDCEDIKNVMRAAVREIYLEEGVNFRVN